MLNFLSKIQPSFGLDVSGTSVRMVELAGSSAGAVVKSFAEVALPKGVIINDSITDSKTFTYLINQIISRPNYGHLDTNRVMASLPESKCFVRVIQIPKMSDAEAENAVPFEAESFIPLPIDQVYLDWERIGEAGDKLNILIAASPRDFVDKYLTVLDQAGLKPATLEVESLSCHRAVVEKNSLETELIVDLDALRTSMIMVEDGALQFTSTIPIAGNTFTESIARSLGVSSAKAEEIKRRVGISNTVEYPNVKLALVPVLNNLASEIKNILKFHSDHSEKQVNRILLAGGSAKLKNLIEFLQPQFADFQGLSIDLANPWKNLAPVKDQALSGFDSLSYVTAIGLALRSLQSRD